MMYICMCVGTIDSIVGSCNRIISLVPHVCMYTCMHLSSIGTRAG